LIASSRFSSPAFYQQMQAYLDKLQVTTNPILSLSLSLSNLKKKGKKERKQVAKRVQRIVFFHSKLRKDHFS
jgi:small neutral amino acid transporter SnatA (MarC family)